MSSIDRIKEVLGQLTPLEILEMCDLSDSPEELVEALDDYIGDKLSDINDNLESNFLMGGEDEYTG